jgi:hypothetical protein
MRKRVVLFVSLILTALTLAPLYAHILEWPGKMALSGADWLEVQHTLYGGYAISGAVTETLGLLSTLLLALLVRHRRGHVVLALIAALCYVSMLAVFALGNNPINAQIASWTASTLPANWGQVRDTWQSFHALSAGLAAVAFGTLLAMVALGVPTEAQSAEGKRAGSLDMAVDVTR